MVDGSVKYDPCRATGGGVIRGPNGEWLMGFCRFIGDCSVLAAEAWSMMDGLEVAWWKGYRNVVVRSDCLNLVRMVMASFQLVILLLAAYGFYCLSNGLFELSSLVVRPIGWHMRWRGGLPRVFLGCIALNFRRKDCKY